MCVCVRVCVCARGALLGCITLCRGKRYFYAEVHTDLDKLRRKTKEIETAIDKWKVKKLSH